MNSAPFTHASFLLLKLGTYFFSSFFYSSTFVEDVRVVVRALDCAAVVLGLGANGSNGAFTGALVLVDCPAVLRKSKEDAGCD